MNDQALTPLQKGTHMEKPPVTIDLIAPEGNVSALIEKARMTLERAGQVEQSKDLGTWFDALPLFGSGVTYDDVRHQVEQYCDVTWLHEKGTSRT